MWQVLLEEGVLNHGKRNLEMGNPERMFLSRVILKGGNGNLLKFISYTLNYDA